MRDLKKELLDSFSEHLEQGSLPYSARSLARLKKEGKLRPPPPCTARDLARKGTKEEDLKALAEMIDRNIDTYRRLKDR